MKPAKLLLILTISAVVLGGGFWAVRQYTRVAPLQRGISVVYEIQLPSDDVKELQTRLDELNERIARTGNDEEKRALGESADRIKADLELANAAVKSDAALAEEMIRILKERVDPDGVSLEWKPIGKNRFEVRMPPPNPTTSAAKDAYLRALDEIRTRNIKPEDLRNLEQGNTTIEKLAAGDKERAIRLGDLLRAYKTLDQKRKSGQPKIQQCIFDWETAESNLLKCNINLDLLKSILSTYIRPERLEKVKDKPGALESLRRRQADYNRAVKGFIGDHQNNPGGPTAIKKVIELHKTWADTHKPFEDLDDLNRMITRFGALEFRIAPVSPNHAGETQLSIPASEAARYVKILRETLEKKGPHGLGGRTDRYRWFQIRDDRKSGYASMITSDYGGRKYLLLSNTASKTLLQNRYGDKWSVINAFWSSDERGMPAVGFNMNEAGAKLLHTLTGNNKGEHLALLLDNEVYSAPVIRSAISKSGIITIGTFNREEVGRMINILRAGVLPARIKPKPVSITPFGPPPAGDK